MTKSLVSFSVDIKDAMQMLEASNKKAAKGLATSVAHSAAIINRNAKEIIGVQRGLVRLPNGAHTWDDASKPGDPPKRRTGRLQRSLKFEAVGKSARIFSEYQGTGKRKNNGFLARLMESGTSWQVYNRRKGTMTPVVMAPRPFTQRAVNKSLSRLPVLLRTELATAFNSQ